jgi:hypothetical protein
MAYEESSHSFSVATMRANMDSTAFSSGIDMLVPPIMTKSRSSWCWRRISSSTWDRCRAFSDALDSKKRSYGSSRYWNGDSHFVGTIAESLVGSLIGCPPNFDIHAEGDGGSDFSCTDVKSSTFLSDPHLKVSPWELKGNDFVLVVVDLPGKRARVAGWADDNMVRNGKSHDYGHGNRYILTERELIQGLPPSLTAPLQD